MTLLEGPAVAAAAAAVAAFAPGRPLRVRAASALAGTAAAALGAVDDLAGSGDRRGFRGHLGALAHGEVTTGAVKIGGIGAAGLAAAAVLGGPALDVAVNTGLIAGTANLVNLFDLRPGRATKVVATGATLLALAAPGERAGRPAGAGAVAPPAGAALALLPEDLAERAMLGDAGANGLGAMLGAAAAASLPRGARLAALAGIASLTAASEVVSFTRVIERTPLLRWIDMLGRRPIAAAEPPDPAGAVSARARPGGAEGASGHRSPAAAPR